MTSHPKIVGLLYIAKSILELIFIAVVLVMFMGLGGIVGVSDARDAMAAGLIIGGVGLVVTLFLAAMALPGLIGGIGLLNNKSWAKVLVLVVSALSLLNFPLGTALAIYAFWALTRSDSRPSF